MKRRLLNSAVFPWMVLPLVMAGHACAETSISTATTAPVATATAANGQPDSLLITTAGSVVPTVSGAAVTVNSNHAVTNNGSISFNDVNDATGVLLAGGAGGGLTNTGSISLGETYVAADGDNDGDVDGVFAQGARRYGVRLGAGTYTGNLNNAGSITVKGVDSAAVLLEGRLVGSLLSSGSISVIGERTVGLSAASVAGDVRVTGAVSAAGEAATAIRLGQIDGLVALQGAITATGYRYTSRLTDAERAKLDADDLKQGGAAVAITGSVGRGLLLDAPPSNVDANDADEDDDGVDDSAELTAAVTSYGGAPAILISGDQALSLGAVGPGALAYGVVNKGQVNAYGVFDGIDATALKIGRSGGQGVIVTGGINNLGGAVVASAYNASATAVLLEGDASVPALLNSGAITATQTGGAHNASAIVDLSGSLGWIESSGTITAGVTATTGVKPTGEAIAIDLTRNGAGATVRQTAGSEAAPSAITGAVRFGAGDDRLEILSGSLTGDMRFGAGADTLVVDGLAKVQGALSDGDGRLTIDLRSGRLGLTNAGAVAVSALNVGATGVFAVTIDPTAGATGGLNVAGEAAFADGAKVEVALTSLLKDPASFEVVRAGSLKVGAVGATLGGAPYLYAASLKANATTGVLSVDLRRKTVEEIGLTGSGAQAYDAVFGALGQSSALQGAFLAQTTQAGFEGLYDQMLPDHAGASLMSAAAISGAIASATAAPRRASTNVDSAVWAQEIAFNIRRARESAAGYASSGFGLAAGAEAISGPQALGLSMSFVSTDYRDRGADDREQVSMSLISGGAYWRVRQGAFQAHVGAGLGYGVFDGKRRLSGAGLDLVADGKWRGWLAKADASAAYTLEAGPFYARPQLSVNYVRLAESGYQERGGGDGFDLKVSSRTGDFLTGEGLMAIGARFGGDDYWAPEVSVGYRQRLAGSPGRTTASFSGGDSFTVDPERPFKSAVLARGGVKIGFSDVLIAVDGGGAFEANYREYDVRAVIRYQF
ncbi:autotransporter outer membrane beta-barrel domain-containing protein [Phenylobacterium immobile]|uniref:autotransporter outer membrane beta-barrel domain-containing protein n=1 Tax=Phenylobacterium immobile TaxID=21 RepID=UPI000AAC369B|nr:autotransporter outer membrane beta-barrel domain-containing protein [Phenylobacterium immobile]